MNKKSEQPRAFSLIVPRAVRPRLEAGSDWNAQRIVLARSADGARELWWWQACRVWGGRGAQYQHPGELLLAESVPRSANPDCFYHREIHSGGRLSRKVLLEHSAEIDDWLGTGTTAQVAANYQKSTVSCP